VVPIWPCWSRATIGAHLPRTKPPVSDPRFPPDKPRIRA
jgi:hypothetical protein